MAITKQKIVSSSSNLSYFNEQSRSNRSLRLKTTRKCPWRCAFCHQEGGWDIDDINWNRSTCSEIGRLVNALDISEVHYTGGEPTSNRCLNRLTRGLVSLGLTVKTTTNGQFDSNTLAGLVKSGLRSYNFSVLSLEAADLAGVQLNMSIAQAEKCILRQKRMIRKAVEFGSAVKINTVVSSIKNIPSAMGVYNFAKKNGIHVRFLNELEAGRTAIDAINMMVVDKLKAEKIREKHVIGTSSTTDYYRDRDGFEFGVKGIREHKLKTLCKGCRERCYEQFYGIRLEQNKGQFFVRLCIHRNDEKSFMSLDRFLNSEQIKEIQMTDAVMPEAA